MKVASAYGTEGNLLISFSSAKQTVEVLKVPLAVVDELIAKGREN